VHRCSLEEVPRPVLLRRELAAFGACLPAWRCRRRQLRSAWNPKPRQSSSFTVMLRLHASAWHDDQALAESLSALSVEDAPSSREAGEPGRLTLVGQCLWRVPSLIVGDKDLAVACALPGQMALVVGKEGGGAVVRLWPSAGLPRSQCIAPRCFEGAGPLQVTPLRFAGRLSAARLTEGTAGGIFGSALAAALERGRGRLPVGPIVVASAGPLAVGARAVNITGALPSVEGASADQCFWVVDGQDPMPRVRADLTLDEAPATPRLTIASHEDSEVLASPVALTLGKHVVDSLRGERPQTLLLSGRLARRAVAVVCERLGVALVWCDLQGMLHWELGATEEALRGSARRAVERGGRGTVWAVVAEGGCLKGEEDEGRKDSNWRDRLTAELRRQLEVLERTEGVCPVVLCRDPLELPLTVREGGVSLTCAATGGDDSLERRRTLLDSACSHSATSTEPWEPRDADLEESVAMRTVLDFEDEAAFAAIVGQEEAKEALFDALRLTAVSSGAGVLLYGPPGCSKTMLARAVASAAKLSFLAASGPSLLGKYVGDAERAVASLFRRAREMSPCALFLDEVDAIASSRDGAEAQGGPTARQRLLNQLLQEMQGVSPAGDGPRSVVVIAATNRPDLVDRALLRAGRLDRLIFVAPPDVAQGARILVDNLLLDKVCPGSEAEHRTAVARAVSDVCGSCPAGAYRSGADFAAIGRVARQLAAVDVVRGEATTLEGRHVERAAKQVPPSISSEMMGFFERFQSSL
jgi:hypothetical protein